MDLIPIRFVGHEIENKEEEKRAVILVPKFESAIVLTLFPRTRNLFYRIRLDHLGTSSWELMDGERNVQQIADQIRKLDNIDTGQLEDMEERLGKFMIMLYERKYITFRQIVEEEKGRRTDKQ